MIAGRYSLDREIGRGGMGAVWLGRDEVLGRAVALKRTGMVPGTASGHALARAEREARLAARLNHPNVVAVFDLAQDDEQQWLVMEYVEGSTLAQLVRERGALSHEQAAQVLAQVADALAAAHAAGIVHRDVKPSNILITPDGLVKLSDFGIARAETEATITETGLVTGSPAYLAPEVASGGSATDASDVWSLGATLFHALAGHPPYEVGDNVLGALYRIVHEEPPRLPDAGWLAPLLAGTMTKDPEDRWRMAEVRDYLAAGPDAAAYAPAVPAPTQAEQVGGPGDDSTRVFDGAAPLAATAVGTRRSPVTADHSRPPPPPAHAAGTRRRSGWLTLFVGIAVLAVLAVAALALIFGNDPADPSAGPTASESARAGGGKSEGSASPTTRPTAQGMTNFVQDYLRTAAADPAAGFRMLTPEFQAESGDFAGYQGFWGAVTGISAVEDVQANVEDMTVSYTYTYQLEDGGSHTETIRLRLVYLDGRYLIADEA